MTSKLILWILSFPTGHRVFGTGGVFEVRHASPVREGEPVETSQASPVLIGSRAVQVEVDTWRGWNG